MNKILSTNSSCLLGIWFFLFLLLIPLHLQATSLYNGKCSDVFSGNSSSIGNSDVLDTIVAEAREKKLNQLGIILLFGTTLASGEGDALGPTRFQAVKEYLEERLPGVVVVGKGQSIGQPSSQGSSATDGKTSTPSGMADIFMVEGERGPNRGKDGGLETAKAEPKKPLEDWQKVLLERYREVEEMHRPLCETERPNYKSYSEECDNNIQSDKDFHLCLFRSEVVRLRDDKLARYFNYDLERLVQLRRTIEEIDAIAGEIVRHTDLPRPSRSAVAALDREIEAQEMAKKYLERALKKANAALKALVPLEDTPKNNISDLSITYSNWIIDDQMYASVYSIKTRRKNINIVGALYNFVRVNLGLDAFDDFNSVFPLCFWINSGFGPGYPQSIQEVDILSELDAPNRHKYGLEEMPLE